MMAVFLPTWIASAKLKLSVIITLGTVGAVGGSSLIAAEHSKSVVKTAIGKTNIGKEISKAYKSVVKAMPKVDVDVISNYALTARDHVLDVPQHLKSLSKTALKTTLTARQWVIKTAFPTIKNSIHEATLLVSKMFTSANAKKLFTKVDALLDKVNYGKNWIKQQITVTIPDWFNTAKGWTKKAWSTLKGVGNSLVGPIKDMFASSDQISKLPSKLLEWSKSFGTTASGLWNLLKTTNITGLGKLASTLMQMNNDPQAMKKLQALQGFMQGNEGIFANMDPAAKAAMMENLTKHPAKAMDILKTIQAMNGSSAGATGAGSSTGNNAPGQSLLNAARSAGINDVKDLNMSASDINYIFSKADSAKSLFALETIIARKVVVAAVGKMFSKLWS